MNAEYLRQLSAMALNELENKDTAQVLTDKVSSKDLSLLIGILENDGMIVVEQYPLSLFVELKTPKP